MSVFFEIWISVFTTKLASSLPLFLKDLSIVISLVFPHFPECFDFTPTHLLFSVCVFIGSNDTLIGFSLWLKVLTVDYFLRFLIESDNDLAGHSRCSIYNRVGGCKTLWRLLIYRHTIGTIPNAIDWLKLCKAPLLLYLRWIKQRLPLFNESVWVHQVSHIVDNEDYDLDEQYQVECHHVIEAWPV